MRPAIRTARRSTVPVCDLWPGGWQAAGVGSARSRDSASRPPAGRCRTRRRSRAVTNAVREQDSRRPCRRPQPSGDGRSASRPPALRERAPCSTPRPSHLDGASEPPAAVRSGQPAARLSARTRARGAPTADPIVARPRPAAPRRQAETPPGTAATARAYPRTC